MKSNPLILLYRDKDSTAHAGKFLYTSELSLDNYCLHRNTYLPKTEMNVRLNQVHRTRLHSEISLLKLKSY